MYRARRAARAVRAVRCQQRVDTPHTRESTEVVPPAFDGDGDRGVAPRGALIHARESGPSAPRPALDGADGVLRAAHHEVRQRGGGEKTLGIEFNGVLGAVRAGAQQIRDFVPWEDLHHGQVHCQARLRHSAQLLKEKF